MVTPIPKAVGLSATNRLKAESDHLAAENDARATLVQALAAVGILAGLYFTARTLRLGAETLSLNAKTLDLTRESQVADRFSKAVTQLGDKSADVRAGAIFALERIARDSTSDHHTVMEILTAYLRERTGTPAIDTYAAIVAIGRRIAEHDRPGWVPNLVGTNLTELDLQGLVLVGSRLSGARLDRASLVEANLSRARLNDASLEDCALADALMQEVDLTDARARGAIFAGTHLEGAHCEHAILDDAVFAEAHIQGAVFTGASLAGVILNNTDTTGAIDFDVP